MKLTTEAILTHPQAFGLTTASPLQRAICRVLDGLPLAELAERDDVREAFGGAEAVRTLHVGTPPVEAHVLAAIRSAKSMIAAAKIVHLSQTIDVAPLSRGDIVRVGVIALRLENTRAVMSHLVENGLARPLLRPLFIGEPSLTGATLRHPSGRPIEAAPLPLDRAGGSLVSTWLGGAVVDEEPRMVGAADGVRNFEHARDSILGRLLTGGQLIGIGSPWSPYGPIYDLVREHFGKPSADMVIVRGKGPDLNPAWWTPERCARLQRTNPTAYRTDVEADFADAEEALIGAEALDAVTRAGPMDLPPEKGRVYVAAIDPATKRNAFTLTIVTTDLVDDVLFYRVVLCRQWMAPRGAPIDLDGAWREIASIVRPYRIHRLSSDQFSVDAMRVIARKRGIELDEVRSTAASKLDAFERLRTVINARQIEINPCRLTRADLLSARKRITQAGMTIELPTTADGRHADFASSLALAVHVASQRPAAPVATPSPIPIPPSPTGFEDLVVPHVYTGPNGSRARNADEAADALRDAELRRSGSAGARPEDHATRFGPVTPRDMLEGF